MTSEGHSSEGDPASRIVDVDTFVSYLVGYRASVVATRASGWEKHPDLHSRVNQDNPRISVSLETIVWDETPQSIREVISFQYPSASVNEEKNIDLRLDIPDGRLLLRLRSASIVSGFRADTPDGKYRSYDKHGKIVIPADGLVLLLKNAKPGSRGDWVISKRPANSSELKFINSGMAEKKYGEISEESLFMAMSKMTKERVAKESMSSRPAVLQEFRDVATILEKGKDRAIWRESLRP